MITPFLTIDPGKSRANGLGFAVFVNATLIACGVIVPFSTDLSSVAIECSDLLRSYVSTFVQDFSVAIVEEMKYLPPDRRDFKARTRADAVANDLLQLQAVGAFVAGRFSSRVIFLPARQWKGNRPTNVIQNLCQRAMTLSEQAVTGVYLRQGQAPTCIPAGKEHNIWDAIGIGFAALGRLKG